MENMKMSRYLVWFQDCPEQIFFSIKKDAEHYARMNAGVVKDLETGETVCSFADSDSNYVELNHEWDV